MPTSLGTGARDAAHDVAHGIWKCGQLSAMAGQVARVLSPHLPSITQASILLLALRVRRMEFPRKISASSSSVENFPLYSPVDRRRWERFRSVFRNNGGVDASERGCTNISTVVGRVASFIQRGADGGNNLDNEWNSVGVDCCRGGARTRWPSGKGELLLVPVLLLSITPSSSIHISNSAPPPRYTTTLMQPYCG